VKLPHQVAAVVRQSGAARPAPGGAGIAPLMIEHLEGFPSTDWIEGEKGRVHYFHCKRGTHWSRCENSDGTFYQCCPTGTECQQEGSEWKCVKKKSGRAK
jgi:hypothetical protein